MSSTQSRWRAPLAGAAAGLAVAAAVAGPSALASGGSAGAPRHTIKQQTASREGLPALGAKARTARAQDQSYGPFLAAIAQLVQSGTINSSQAQVLDADIRAGSIDPTQLLASHTLTPAQMQAVNDRLVAVKKSLGSRTQNSGAGTGKAPQG